jgi:predicted nuclease with TOPRIM domain
MFSVAPLTPSQTDFFRLAYLERNNDVLQTNYNSLLAEKEDLLDQVQLHIEEEDDLKKKLEQLTAENAALKDALHQSNEKVSHAFASTFFLLLASLSRCTF